MSLTKVFTDDRPEAMGCLEMMRRVLDEFDHRVLCGEVQGKSDRIGPAIAIRVLDGDKSHLVDDCPAPPTFVPRSQRPPKAGDLLLFRKFLE